MNNFSFRNPTKLIFGKDTIANLAKEIPTGKTIMITFGGGSVKQNGVYDQVKDALKNHKTVEFWGIEPNPTYETLLKAVALGKENKVDFLLAVGGGSVLDGTKFIAAAMCFQGAEPWDLMQNPRLITAVIPMGTVLTLPATGSEMNSGAVISRKATQEKLALGTPLNFPVFSILDPQTTFSLPKNQVAAGIVDSFVHVLEQYLTYPSQSPLMDRWAEGILQTLVEIAPEAMKQENYDVMANFMLCATMALNGFIAMGVPQDWATHMIGHELTAYHGITHGFTLAIVCPALMQVMKADKHDKLLQYAERVWQITEGTNEQKINQCIEKTEQFFRSVGVNTRLSEYGVGKDTIEKIVNRFTERNWIVGEKRNITPSIVREILEKAL